MNEIIDFLKAIIGKIFYNDASKISIDDDLFNFGLDSLSLIMLTSKIINEYNIEIPISFLYKHSTIRQIANYIAEEKNINSVKDS